MGIMLDIDASEVIEKFERAKDIITADNMRRAAARSFRETARHTRVVLSKDLPVQYHIPAMEVRSAVGSPRIGGFSCVIPVTGKRRSIGGSGYAAKGGHPGWNPPHYNITAKIVKSGTSTLPDKASSYGGQPPFRNTAARKSGVAVHAFTRGGKSRFPIEKMVGIAIPQMPTNRSREDVQEDIKTFLEKRVDHYIQLEISKI